MTDAEAYADGLAASLTTFVGQNMNLLPYTITQDRTIAQILGTAAVASSLQVGKNAIQFAAADETEYAVSGILGAPVQLGHMDMLYFSWNGTTASDYVVVDDRASQLANAVTFELQTVKDTLVTAFPGLTFPS